MTRERLDATRTAGVYSALTRSMHGFDARPIVTPLSGLPGWNAGVRVPGLVSLLVLVALAVLVLVVDGPGHG